MKHFPNILSFLRIFLSISLAFLHYGTGSFIIVYLFCGLTDILDGYIARKFNLESIFGAKIDSFADIFMFIMITYIVVIQKYELLQPFLILILLITLIKLINLLMPFFKCKKFASIHTWANKLTGMLIFIVPLLLHNSLIILSICIIAFLSAIEELLIHIFIPNSDLNRRSIFFK